MKKKNLFDTNERWENYYDLGAVKTTLKPSESYSVAFDVPPGELKDRKARIQVRGNTAIPKSYREEPKYPVLYRRICESLEGNELVARGDGQPIARGLYYKVYTDEIRGGHDFTLEIEYILKGSISSQDIKIEVFYRNGGKSTVDNSVGDIIKTIEIVPTTAYAVATATFKALEEVDFMFISIIYDGLDGELRMLAPRLINSSHQNILKPFEMLPIAIKTPRWVGENYSKLEWVPFEISFNGVKVFDGVKFDRIYVRPTFEFDIPDGIIRAGDNSLTVTYPRTYASQGNFDLTDIKLITTPSQCIVAGKTKVALGVLPILIKVMEDNSTVELRSDIAAIAPSEKVMTCAKGLQVAAYEIVAPFEGVANLTIIINGKEYVHHIDRYLLKEEDVITGSGDSIYMALNKADFEEFFAWYFRNGLGNAVTFRTAYRWSGCNYSEAEFWESTAKLLSSLGVRYSVMIDGRELNGAKTNGDGFNDESPLFDGFQSHEQDGAYYYWGSVTKSREEVFFNELCGRRFSKHGMLPKGCIIREGDSYRVHYKVDAVTDMAGASAQLVENFKKAASNATRHTGPSVLFKYLAEAGIEWLGAELLYGTMDLIISGLRGASKAMGNPSYGGHLAIQWSSSPHDTVERYRRYLQSLLLCYMKGLDQINTEEGFYRMEEGKSEFERDSAACLNMSAIQRKFTDYVATHTRRGKMTVNMGLISGKYDSVNMFTKGNVYGQKGLEWVYGAPEKSWELASEVFYPNSRATNVYRHPCPNKSVGFFTRTPYGEVDIVPIESENSVLSQYKCLAMVGWNTADDSQIDKLLQFAHGGGTLLLAIPHLYTTTKRSQAISHVSNILFSDKVKSLIGISEIKRNNQLTLSTGKACGSEYGESNEDIIVNRVGKGEVIFVNRFKYPGQIKTLYSKMLTHLACMSREYRNSSGKVEIGKSWVTTSVFDDTDRRTIYMLDIKWWKSKKKDEKVDITLGAYTYGITLKRDMLNVCACLGDIGVVTQDWNTDIISRIGRTITLQGEGLAKLIILKDGLIATREVELNGITSIEI